ncbi:ubiquinol cytochrome C oxidoreductase [Stenotrophomonas pictorum JCM 9942]|jgi:ubiquinol-cytochrome c reductase cytochrome c1 subunit|uniref:Ubiquinol cytochrome C oxidoreductase n=1 Tax=Stenotrophomonas pictorum JCM 9942 TaxID=1236960 RepID=A0A0R0AL71_9GAMM|nr:cytochrome c1 [Stenotrophomonas pictorum]KRG41235.1 ubiquinol cytochrome C oxidoreductase [Stenotrophomonas pictorum JCM 9942]
MTDKWMVRLLFAAAMLFCTSASAADGGALQQAGNDLGDRASLQRGAQAYMSYCSGCHSLKYLRYSRMAEDLGLTEEQVMDNLNFTGAAFGEQIQVALPHEAATQWFGKMPPDLSLIARVRGSDWIYSYLKSFYVDESRPLGWNNAVFPNASMPNPLWELQGMQHAVYGKAEQPGLDPPVTGLKIDTPGKVDARAYDQTVRDITNFLEYAGEPAALKRQSIGVWVVLFLALLTFLAYLLKTEYWKDVH